MVGGYSFSVIWSCTRYYISRESGHKLYFRSAFYGIFLVVCSFFIHVILFSRFQVYRDFLLFFNGELPLSNPSIFVFGQEAKIAVLLISFILGPIFAVLLNFPKIPLLYNLKIPLYKKKPFYLWERTLLKSAIKHNDFEKLILRAAEESLLILFTLNNGKVYVGWAVRAPNPAEKRTAVRILPMLSGYRNPSNHKISFTTDYYEILQKATNENLCFEHLRLEDLEVVLSSDQIISSRLFDLETWEHFKKNNKWRKLLRRYWSALAL